MAGVGAAIKGIGKAVLKNKKRSASPSEIDHYHKVMTSDFKKKTGPFFKGKK